MSSSQNLILHTMDNCFCCNLMIKCLDELDISYQVTVNNPEINAYPTLQLITNNELTYEIIGFTLETKQLIINNIKKQY